MDKKIRLTDKDYQYISDIKDKKSLATLRKSLSFILQEHKQLKNDISIQETQKLRNLLGTK